MKREGVKWMIRILQFTYSLLTRVNRQRSHSNTVTWTRIDDVKKKYVIEHNTHDMASWQIITYGIVTAASCNADIEAGAFQVAVRRKTNDAPRCVKAALIYCILYSKHFRRRRESFCCPDSLGGINCGYFCLSFPPPFGFQIIK